MSDQSAQSFSVEDLENKILQALFGNTPFVGFVPYIKKLFNQTILGTEDDALLDSVLYSNMTPTGVYTDQQNMMQRRIAERQSANLKRASRSQWFEAAAKSMMSFEDWVDSNASTGWDKTIESYNAYMQNRAAGFADNAAIGWALDTAGFDPDGISQVRRYLTKAGSNIATHRRGVGDIGALAATQATRGIFTNDAGQLDYDKRDYGYMTMGETATVIAALTRDIDFFRNLPENKNMVEKIRMASEEIKRQAQEYTKAMAPLKDVFGSDIPEMIRTIEQVSGQRFTQLSSGSVRDISARLVAGADAGRYTLNQLAVVSNQVSGAIQQMDVPIINDIGAMAQSQMVLGITNTGLVPAAMSAHRFEQLAYDNVLRTANSRGATALSQAYALWRERQEEQARAGDQPVRFTNDDDAFAVFQREYEGLREQGMTADRAILEMSGAPNLYSLQEAAGSQYYAHAVERNLGGRIAMKESRDKRIQAARLDAFAQGRENGEAFNKAIEILDEDINLLNGSEEDWINSGVMDPEVRRQLRAIRNNRYGDLAAVLSSYQAAVDTEKRTQTAVDLRTGIDALNETFATNASDWIGRFLNVGNARTPGGLPKLESIREFLQQTTNLKGADPQIQELMTGAMAASIGLADFHKLDIDGARTYVSDMLKYAAKDGVNNARFLDAIKAFSNPELSDDERRTAMLDLEIARNTSDELLENYEAAFNKDKTLLYEALENGVSADELGDVIKGELFYQNLSNDVQRKGTPRAVAALRKGGEFLREQIKTYMAKNGEATGEQLYETIAKTATGSELIQGIGEDAVKRLINEQITKSDSPPRTQSDLFGMFDKLVTEFSTLSGNFGSLEGKLTELLSVFKSDPAAERNASAQLTETITGNE